jgi:hypothetical protein
MDRSIILELKKTKQLGVDKTPFCVIINNINKQREVQIC